MQALSEQDTHSQDWAFGDLVHDADKIKGMLDQHLRHIYSPTAEKSLRTFTGPEVAKLLKISPSYLRKLHADGVFPDIEADSRKRRQYTASDILELRQILAEKVKGRADADPRRKEGEQCQVLTVSTFKGGSGKTTTTFHLAQSYALKGYRVLAIDLDPQASLTTMFGVTPEFMPAGTPTMYDALRYDEPQPMSQVIQETYFDGLDLAPAALLLSEFEVETPTALRNGGDIPFYLRLMNAIEEIESFYDIILIDCPPQLGYITLAAFFAATGLIVPIVPNMIDVASLSQYLTMAEGTIEAMRENGAELDAKFIRYVLCRHEPNDKPQAQLAAVLRTLFGERLMAASFHKSTAVSNAGLQHMSIYEVTSTDVHRDTLARVIDSFESVSDELEAVLHSVWGR